MVAVDTKNHVLRHFFGDDLMVGRQSLSTEQSAPLSDLNPVGTTLHLLQRQPTGETFDRLWLIDGDDTLWEDNFYYSKLASYFANYILAHRPNYDGGTQAVRELLDKVEHETIAKEGFGPIGFLKSLQITCTRIKSVYRDFPSPTELFELVVPLLSDVPYSIDPQVTVALKMLKDRGDALVLFTQGPREIQYNKVIRSGLSDCFHAVALGTDKKEATYLELVQSLSFRGSRIIVVGNSLSSEVAPALRLGYEAVHFLNPHTWKGTNTSEPITGGYQTIDSISKLVSLL